jgi:trafficking protein particle complex subunit 6
MSIIHHIPRSVSPGNPVASLMIAPFADPPLRLMDGAAMDYFLIEMVNTLRISSAVASARSQRLEQEMIDAGLLSASPLPPSSKKDKRDSTGSLTSYAGQGLADDDDEGLRSRLESIGMHVGANITERYIPGCSFISSCTYTSPDYAMIGHFSLTR